ncbi:MAG TPA: hypothetical protein VFE88_01335 [Candidatus Nanoarchaeia archaeon]|nr:hypothetical protein [Candidatus Nanoarchaeia archaeon]
MSQPMVKKEHFILLAILLLTSTATASIITPSSADGLLAYGENNLNNIRYKTWNTSFSTEQTTTFSGNEEQVWTILRANHKRDELIIATADRNEDLTLQVFLNNNTQGFYTQPTLTLPDSSYRSFDLAYEEQTGRALLVYEKNNTNDNLLPYILWNGTSYSQESYLTTTLTAREARWISLIPQPQTNNIMLLIQNHAGGSQKELYAILWNGTRFTQETQTLLSANTGTSTNQHYSFAWETQNNEGLLVYGEQNNLLARSYNGTWSTAQSFSLGNTLETATLCPDPTSNYIGVILQDGGNDINVKMWNGTTFLSQEPSQDGTTEPHGSNTLNIACSWHQDGTTALFSFIDSDQRGLDYFTFTKSERWSTSNLETTASTASFATDSIAALSFSQHPTTNEIMILALDRDNDLHTLRWDGTSFSQAQTHETESPTPSAAQQPATYAWHRFDPGPGITFTFANNQTFNQNTNITLNATITDNINVSAASLTLTLPNANTLSLTFNKNGNIYSTSYLASQGGIYLLTITANDTRNTLNTTERTFIIQDTEAPSLIVLTPTINADYSPGQAVGILANVTDNGEVATVVATLFTPDLSRQELILTQDNNLYTASFTTTTEGTYTYFLTANDTRNNLNTTTNRTFTITSPSSPPPSLGGGGSSGDGGAGSAGPRAQTQPSSPAALQGELSYTVRPLALSRGTTNTIPLTIKNQYKHTVLQGLTVETFGPNKELLTVRDDPTERALAISTGNSVTLTREKSQQAEYRLTAEEETPPQTSTRYLYYTDEKTYIITIDDSIPLPEDEEFTVTVKVTGTLVSQQPELTGFTVKPITETKTFTFELLAPQTKEQEEPPAEPPAEKNSNYLWLILFLTTLTTAITFSLSKNLQFKLLNYRLGRLRHKEQALSSFLKTAPEKVNKTLQNLHKIQHKKARLLHKRDYYLREMRRS